VPAIHFGIYTPLVRVGRESYQIPIFASHLRVQPGAPHTVAVLRGQYSSTTPTSSDVAIFDDAVLRPTFVSSIVTIIDTIDWKADGSTLFGQDTLSTERSLYTFTVNSSGVTLAHQYGGAFRQSGVHLHSDPQTGYVYTDQGEVVDTSNGLPRGNYHISQPLEARRNFPS
jgi:hypothetical protein